MIIKGRSPTMRHVSRIHRVALDWLFDRINLDTTIQIKCIDTKHQLGDILTKGNFTRDEWNNVLHLFNISHLIATCCAKNSSLKSCTKKMATSKSAAMNLSSHGPTSSSSVNHPIASKSLGILKASTVKLDVTVRRNLKPDAASSSQGL